MTYIVRGTMFFYPNDKIVECEMDGRNPEEAIRNAKLFFGIAEVKQIRAKENEK